MTRGRPIRIAALVALLRAYHHDYRPLAAIHTVYTIHNLAYQGRFWHWDMLLTGLDWKYFNWHQMEFHGDLNLLKTGLVFADAISTVSPAKAKAPAVAVPPRGVPSPRTLFSNLGARAWTPP